MRAPSPHKNPAETDLANQFGTLKITPHWIKGDHAGSDASPGV
jgi:hypothetical protein